LLRELENGKCKPGKFSKKFSSIGKLFDFSKVGNWKFSMGLIDLSFTTNILKI